MYTFDEVVPIIVKLVNVAIPLESVISDKSPIS